MSAFHDRVGDLTLFEALMGGAFDGQNWQHSREFDQNFSKNSNAPGFARGGGDGWFWNWPVHLTILRARVGYDMIDNRIMCILYTPRPIYRSTSRSTYQPTVDRCISRRLGRVSADMSVDISIEWRSICRPRCVRRQIDRCINRDIGRVMVDVSTDYRQISRSI